MFDGSGIVNYVLTIARENQKQESGPTTLQVAKASWCYMAEPTRYVWFVLGRLASNSALNLRVMAITNHGNRRSGRKVFRYPKQLPTEARFGGDAARCNHRLSFQCFCSGRQARSILDLFTYRSFRLHPQALQIKQYTSD